MKQNIQNSPIFWIASFLAITLCTLVSCEKEIEFKGEQIDPKLVINSIVEPGKPVKAYISKSMFFLDNEGNTQAPADLVATLYVNGNRIGEMTPTEDTVWQGYQYVDLDSVKPVYKTVLAYVSDYRPNMGDIVKITALANGFDDVDGSTSPLPNEVAWSILGYQIIDWEYIEPYDGYYDEFEEDTIWQITGKIELTIEVTDPNPGQIDYFRIQVEDASFSDDINVDGLYIGVSYDDPVFGANISNDDVIAIDFDFQSRPQGVFTDVIFDGKSYQIKLPLNLYLNLIGGTLPEYLQLPVSMEHLSKEYYNYLNTCEQADEIMQFFAEPVQTFSNINSGYGIVGGHTLNSRSINLPLEPNQ